MSLVETAHNSINNTEPDVEEITGSDAKDIEPWRVTVSVEPDPNPPK